MGKSFGLGLVLAAGKDAGSLRLSTACLTAVLLFLCPLPRSALWRIPCGSESTEGLPPHWGGHVGGEKGPLASGPHSL